MSNMYVAGSSVFPTAGANFPTFTLVALSLRLADHLADVLQAPDATARTSSREATLAAVS
jgi:choline dehydrogenase-like flavoprotein